MILKRMHLNQVIMKKIVSDTDDEDTEDARSEIGEDLGGGDDEQFRRLLFTANSGYKSPSQHTRNNRG
ncbi:hypothetical protein JTB14_034468 [Gonioctena quinquepunctata]|nr:hypothetical protein JTB14_034468 [Gonioctena quinquepunctata]